MENKKKKKINSRAKGATYERTISKYLRDRGYEARRGQQFCGANGDADIITSVMLGAKKPHFELKAVENLNIHKAMEQATDDAKVNSEIPVVIHKKNSLGSLVTMKLDDFFDMLDDIYKDI